MYAKSFSIVQQRIFLIWYFVATRNDRNGALEWLFKIERVNEEIVKRLIKKTEYCLTFLLVYFPLLFTSMGRTLTKIIKGLIKK
jgi:hypothetical protein